MLTTLSNYPIDVVREVTSLDAGIQRTCKFPPRTAEIVTACEEVLGRFQRHAAFRDWGKRAPEPVPDEPKMTREQLEARYGGSILPPGYGESAEFKRRVTEQAKVPTEEELRERVARALAQPRPKKHRVPA